MWENPLEEEEKVLAGPFRHEHLPKVYHLVLGEKAGLFAANPRSASFLRIPVGFPLLSLPGKSVLGLG
jgi:hypothetical protein